MADGIWEFKAWIRVPGDSEDEQGARERAESFADEASKGEATVSIEDIMPTHEES